MNLTTWLIRFWKNKVLPWLRGTNFCEHEGCTREARDYYLPEEPERAYWLCWEHAYLEGWCSGCGGFWGGVESFEFSDSWLCENCRDDEGVSEEEEDLWDFEDCYHD